MPRVRISIWLPVLLCLFYRFDTQGAFFPLLIAVVVHELGHILCICSTGARVTSLAFVIGGAIIETSPLSYGQEALCALAGPCASLLTLLVTNRIFPWLAFWAAAQGIFNLLPVYPLDGGRFLRTVLCLRLAPFRAEAVSKAVGIVTVIAVLILCLWYPLPMLSGPWRILPAGILFAQAAPFLWENR